MPSRAWTGDILADLLQLPSEIVEYVLESLAEYELDDFARTPLGEFTWRPLLVGIQGYEELGAMYAPIWTRKVASAMRMVVRTWANGAHAKHHFCSADEIAWVLRNSMIYGPIRTDEGGDDYFHDTPYNRQEFDACPIDGSRLWTPSHLDGCPCQAYITLVAHFGPGSQHGSMFNWVGDNVRYVVQIVPHNDASNLDDLGCGLRHLFMWNGDGARTVLWQIGVMVQTAHAVKTISVCGLPSCVRREQLRLSSQLSRHAIRMNLRAGNIWKRLSGLASQR